MRAGAALLRAGSLLRASAACPSHSVFRWAEAYCAYLRLGAALPSTAAPAAVPRPASTMLLCNPLYCNLYEAALYRDDASKCSATFVWAWYQ